MNFLRKIAKKWLYSSFPGFAGVFPYFGTNVYFPKNSLIFTLACEQGIYESENLFLLQSLIEPNSFYFDIGANIGLMSIPILTNNPTCKVVSFEPSPSVLPFLKRTVDNSPFKERWVVLGKALSDQLGVSDFFTSNSGMEALGGLKDTRRADTNIKIEVPVSTIDIEWKIMGKPKVSIIKIDVEGAEFQVLNGAINCIDCEKPFVLLEWNAVNLKAYHSEPNQLLKIASEIDYQIFSVLKVDSKHLSINFIPVSDPMNLKLQMLSTESFLLIPKHKLPDSYLTSPTR